MRLGGLTIMLAVLLGAGPALAQDSPGIMPGPAQSVEKSKPVHIAPKKVASKVAAKTTAPTSPAPTIAAPATVAPKSAALEPQPASTEPAQEAPAGISIDDRQKIQSALSWSGDYTARSAAKIRF